LHHPPVVAVVGHADDRIAEHLIDHRQRDHRQNHPLPAAMLEQTAHPRADPTVPAATRRDRPRPTSRGAPEPCGADHGLWQDLSPGLSGLTWAHPGLPTGESDETPSNASSNGARSFSARIASSDTPASIAYLADSTAASTSSLASSIAALVSHAGPFQRSQCTASSASRSATVRSPRRYAAYARRW